MFEALEAASLRIEPHEEETGEVDVELGIREARELVRRATFGLQANERERRLDLVAVVVGNHHCLASVDQDERGPHREHTTRAHETIRQAMLDDELVTERTGERDIRAHTHLLRCLLERLGLGIPDLLDGVEGRSRDDGSLAVQAVEQMTDSLLRAQLEAGESMGGETVVEPHLHEPLALPDHPSGLVWRELVVSMAGVPDVDEECLIRSDRQIHLVLLTMAGCHLDNLPRLYII